MRHVASQIMRKEGIPGFYRGFIPSAVKNLPNKGDTHINLPPDFLSHEMLWFL